MKIGRNYQIFLLLAVVFFLYYPSLSAGINPVDDSRIIAQYERSSISDIKNIFKPSASYYYRPLLELSFYIDNQLWNMHPRFMHLENIIMHAINAVLVFLIAVQLNKLWGSGTALFPLAAALIFAVHPINTESVTWIAGRTDPLAAVFVFSAYWCLIQCLITERRFYLALSILLFLLGLLTKEIAICFLPTALLVALFWPVPSRRRSMVIKTIVSTAAMCTLIVISGFMLKSSFSISALMSSTSAGLFHDLQNVITSLGFYLKKLVFPFPLNFAIDVISPHYVIIGLFFIVLYPLFFMRYRFISILIACCVIFMLPSLLISIRQVAWAPYAERYLYIPSAFFCMGVTSVAAQMPDNFRLGRWRLISFMCILSIAMMVTLQRNIEWQDPLKFYRKAVRLSPDFGAVHFELGSILLSNGKLQEARKELEAADRLNKRPSIKYLIKANMMALKFAEKDYDGAREYFYQLFPNPEDADSDFLGLLNKVNHQRAYNQSGNIKKINEIFSEMIATNNILYQKSKDPFHLYQNAKLFLQLGKKALSRDCLKKAVKEAPVDSHYVAAAATMLQKLENSQ